MEDTFNIMYKTNEEELDFKKITINAQLIKRLEEFLEISLQGEIIVGELLCLCFNGLIIGESLRR